jgi:regulatory protein
MPTITKIVEVRGRARRRVIFIDNIAAVRCTANLVTRMNLCAGQTLSDEQLNELHAGTHRQACFDQAIKFIQRRPLSSRDLATKLAARGFEAAMVRDVLDDLARLGYLNDAQFAVSRATTAAQTRHHGPRRALAELAKAGINREVARRAVQEVFENTDTLAVARALAAKQAPRLRRLDAITARRRLAGMLARRGFEYETIRPVIDEVLGPASQAAREGD